MESVVNGHYGAYYLTDTSDADQMGNVPTVNIWYPELSIQAELTTDDFGGTSGDSIDGKTISKDDVVSFLINAPKVGGPAQIGATAKIVFTTSDSGRTSEFGGVNLDNVRLKAPQTTAGWADAGNNAIAGTWTVRAEFTFPKVFYDYAKKSNTIAFTLQNSILTLTAAKDSVVRNNPFTVIISGKAQVVYAVYLENAINTDVNPTLQTGQTDFQGYFLTNNTNGVNTVVIDGGFSKTDASGKRIIQYNTTADTEDKS